MELAHCCYARNEHLHETRLQSPCTVHAHTRMHAHMLMKCVYTCCRFDHLLGMYITEGGKYRRLDLIFTIPVEMPFCLLGWTGSKQYERLLRQHAVDCGMKLSSHGCALVASLSAAGSALH